MTLHAAILRPGALGDVLAARAPMGLLKARIPDCRITLLAPGDRGRLLQRPGLADAVFDLDRAESAWLFAPGALDPPHALRTLFQEIDTAVAYLEDPEGHVCRALGALGCTRVIRHPSRPPAEAAVHIHEHLNQALAGCLPAAPESPMTAPAIEIRSACLRPILKRYDLHPGMYAVLHPGSGSPRKNWPGARFSALASRLGARLRVVITAGEADGRLGRDVAHAAPGALLVELPRLEELAALLAGARLYVGNDSGVSHLAGAVSSSRGSPACVVLFGPTSPRVWAPPGARILHAQEGELAALTVAEVLRACPLP